MIEGEFDGFGRPHIEGYLILPRMDVAGNVSFRLDTGADATCLHPKDARDLRAPFEELENGAIYQGVGGSASYFRESPILYFADRPWMQAYELDLLIPAPSETNENLPSLLGLDVINFWYIQYDPGLSRLQCAARYADSTFRE